LSRLGDRNISFHPSLAGRGMRWRSTMNARTILGAATLATTLLLPGAAFAAGCGAGGAIGGATAGAVVGGPVGAVAGGVHHP
jgi:hypothetical protein